LSQGSTFIKAVGGIKHVSQQLYSDTQLVQMLVRINSNWFSVL